MTTSQHGTCGALLSSPGTHWHCLNLWALCAVAVQLPLHCSYSAVAVAVQLQLQFRCSCTAVTVQLQLQCSCSCNAVAVQLQCSCCSLLQMAHTNAEQLLPVPLPYWKLCGACRLLARRPGERRRVVGEKKIDWEKKAGFIL